MPIFIPPLRERKEDIPKLIEHFLEKFGLKCHKHIKGITREARDSLLKYHYPGNIRELENIIERAVVLTRHDVIDEDDLPIQMRPNPLEELPTDKSHSVSQLANAERRLILKALENNEWVQTKAAEQLGISERVLRYKMKKHDIQRK